MKSRADDFDLIGYAFDLAAEYLRYKNLDCIEPDCWGVIFSLPACLAQQIVAEELGL